jgi:hypothetical protein
MYICGANSAYANYVAFVWNGRNGAALQDASRLPMCDCITKIPAREAAKTREKGA